MSSRVEDDGLQEPPAKAPEPLFLDLSKVRYQNREELQNALWKIPDLRMRHDRLWDEEVLCQFPRKSLAFPFPNPVPASLSTVRIRDLSQVNIDWRMMTLLRPKTKLEEDLFTRLIQLDRLNRQITENEVPNSLRLGTTRTFKPNLVQTRSTSHGPSSPRGKKHQVAGSDDEEEISKPQTERFGYEFYVRESSIDSEEKEITELVSSVSATSLDIKKHKRTGRKDIQSGLEENVNKTKSKDRKSKTERKENEDARNSKVKHSKHGSTRVNVESSRKSKVMNSNQEVIEVVGGNGRKSKMVNRKQEPIEKAEEDSRKIMKKNIDVKRWLNEVVGEVRKNELESISMKKSKKAKKEKLELESNEKAIVEYSDN